MKGYYDRHHSQNIAKTKPIKKRKEERKEREKCDIP
jgi:hypothetical protein